TAITFVLAKKIFRPLVEISAATKEIVKGNFDIEIKGDYKIKELRELAFDFNKMIKELKGTDALKSDFIINVSHELKT
ncbi:MAG TPA: two-component sensor histidine kinase, partial [Clostridiales bacterium]|nr:two-component sensor histidine kinase [Clostridiales bacterium]